MARSSALAHLIARVLPCVSAGVLPLWTAACGGRVIVDRDGQPQPDDEGETLDALQCSEIPWLALDDAICTLSGYGGEGDEVGFPCAWECRQGEHVWKGHCDGVTCTCSYDDTQFCSCDVAAGTCRVPSILEDRLVCCSRD